ncbi:MAG TPA: hypothetical protein VFQ77_17185 [Pseudonocardiaceae bacterium]|jgi:hypothetical protein|nr:hypothetical protein [Pseudonocardiaceae bacterium]
MLKTDQVLWEQELAEHMRLHGIDLLDLPPAGRLPALTRKWLTRLLLWTPVAVVGGTLGWSVGWYLI